MRLNFLPTEILFALENVDLKYVTEIRLRKGQPVIIGYRGEYNYIDKYGLTENVDNAIFCTYPEDILNTATERSIYSYAEQLKCGYITVNGGVRIGIGGEYVTEGDYVSALRSVTSLNVRIPHDACGCSKNICNALYRDGAVSTLIFSPPGYGKTTLLRDIARFFGLQGKVNVLIYDERNEIAALDGDGLGYKLGSGCDVIRGGNKQNAFTNAVRVMNPQLIITDELYGEGDLSAVRFASRCGIKTIASSHYADKELLKDMPFNYFIELTGVGKRAIIYDKNFNIVGDCSTFCDAGDISVG